MSLRVLQRKVAVTLMASDSFGGRDLLINANPGRGKLALRKDTTAPADWQTGVNQQRWLLSVPYLAWLSFGIEFPQAQSELTVAGADIPDGFKAGVYKVIEVVGLDPNVNVVLQKNI